MTTAVTAVPQVRRAVIGARGMTGTPTPGGRTYARYAVQMQLTDLTWTVKAEGERPIREASLDALDELVADLTRAFRHHRAKVRISASYGPGFDESTYVEVPPSGTRR